MRVVKALLEADMDALDVLQARGFIKQCTGLETLRAMLNEGQVTYYVGFDPTAASLHVGHLLPIMAMAWLQRAGHRPIALVGSATAMVGDPTGRTELREMLTEEKIAENMRGVRVQLKRFLNVDGEAGVLANNIDWMRDMGYIQFLRDIGRHFSVNRMLAAEAYKQRMERGLSFIEFNYQLLQAYDFLHLHRAHGCTLQMGGDDQWGNILAGTDLVRRMEGAEVHGLTFPLLTTASGAKMGKTAAGAVWLNGDMCSPFDYYQYWINVDDRDVGKLLRLYTFLPLDEVERLEALTGADIREAKRVLAREATRLAHGDDLTRQAEEGAAAMVSGKASSDVPTFAVSTTDLAGELKVYAVLAASGTCKSRSDARRMIKGGAVRLNGERISNIETLVTEDDFQEDGVLIRVGKKRAVRVIRQT